MQWEPEYVGVIHAGIFIVLLFLITRKLFSLYVRSIAKPKVHFAGEGYEEVWTFERAEVPEPEDQADSGSGEESDDGCQPSVHLHARLQIPKPEGPGDDAQVQEDGR